METGSGEIWKASVTRRHRTVDEHVAEERLRRTANSERRRRLKQSGVNVRNSETETNKVTGGLSLARSAWRSRRRLTGGGYRRNRSVAAKAGLCRLYEGSHSTLGGWQYLS